MLNSSQSQRKCGFFLIQAFPRLLVITSNMINELLSDTKKKKKETRIKEYVCGFICLYDHEFFMFLIYIKIPGRI